MTESVFLTAVIEAEQRRDVATFDIPNAFIQTEVEEFDEHGDRNVMKIKGAMIDMLIEIDESYRDYVAMEMESECFMCTSLEQSTECSCRDYYSTRSSEPVLNILAMRSILMTHVLLTR